MVGVGVSDAEPDGALIQRSVHGHPDAFVEVVRRHEVAIHAYLVRRAGRQAAGDLLAEVWLRAFAARGGYDIRYGDARPWLYGIARNVLREHWRTNGGDEPTRLDEAGIDPWDSVDDRLDSVERAKAVISAVRALPAADREVLLTDESAEFVAVELLRAIGVVRPPEPHFLEEAREALWSVIASEMLGRGPAAAGSTAMGTSTREAEEERRTVRRRQLGRSPDERRRALGGGPPKS